MQHTSLPNLDEWNPPLRKRGTIFQNDVYLQNGEISAIIEKGFTHPRGLRFCGTVRVYHRDVTMAIVGLATEADIYVL